MIIKNKKNLNNTKYYFIQMYNRVIININRTKNGQKTDKKRTVLFEGGGEKKYSKGVEKNFLLKGF
jgi:hypothetical protein